MRFTNSVNYFAIVIFSLLGIVACAGFPDKNQDPAKNNVTTHKIDMRDCAQSYPETPDGVYIKQRISCMNLKGWN